MSSSLNCGKMKALEQLLQTWHDERDSKVGPCASSSCEIIQYSLQRPLQTMCGCELASTRTCKKETVFQVVLRTVRNY